MADWVVVPALQAMLREMNDVFPQRQKASDGAIGDTSHSARPSGHNPDETGSPEDTDADSINEVRARDFDTDLNHPTVSMEEVCQHLLRECRAGRVTWIKYIIFDRRIWSASTGWAQRQYNGSNPHDKHLHVSCKPDTASENTTRPLGLRNLVEDDMPLSDADVDKVAAEVIRRLDTAPIRNNRTLGGTLNALASGDGADNPIARAVWAREFGDPEQPPNPDGTEKVRTTGYWQRFTHQEIHNLGRVLTRMDAREAAEVPPTATQNARAVVEALAADTPERTAAALRVALGPRAAAVGRLLAEDFAAAASHAAEHSGPPTTR